MALCLSACASLTPADSYTMNTYRFTVNNKPINAVTTSSYVLLLPQATVNPGFDTSAMLYQKQPYQLQSFSKNAWVSPPAGMLTTVMTENLTNLNYFKAVLNPGPIVKPDYTLTTRLIALYQDFTVTPSTIVFAVNVTLMNNVNNTISASKTFTYNMPCTAATPYAGVSASNKALAQFLQDLDAWLLSQIK